MIFDTRATRRKVVRQEKNMLIVLAEVDLNKLIVIVGLRSFAMRFRVRILAAEV